MQSPDLQAKKFTELTSWKELINDAKIIARVTHRFELRNLPHCIVQFIMMCFRA